MCTSKIVFNLWSSILVVSVLACSTTLAQVETWDADLAGWMQSTTSSVPVHVAVGGNTDGHVQLRKDLGGLFDMIGIQTDSNANFLGDYGAAGIRRVSVDLNMFNSSVTDSWVRFRRNAAENGWRYSFGAIAPNANQWENYTTGFFDPTWDDLQARAAGWITDFDVDNTAIASPTFATVMSGVGRAEVRFDTANGVSTLVGIDNFSVTVIPEPTSAVLLGVGSLLASLRRRHAKT